jgi:hypothetical protein
MEETVTLPKKEYQKLLEDQEKLAALEEAGVDRWEGYAKAMQTFFAMRKLLRRPIHGFLMPQKASGRNDI